MRRITIDYEKLYKENFDLKEKIEALEEQLNTYRQMEKTLNDTLYLAQETANEMKAAGEKKAEVILREAEQRAEQMRMRVRRKSRRNCRTWRNSNSRWSSSAFNSRGSCRH